MIENTIKEMLISIISKRCDNVPYLDVADAVDDIFKLPFESVSEIMIEWMKKNKHPHMMAEIDCTRATLWEANKSHLTFKSE